MILVEMEIHANSFAEAERLSSRVMADAFNTSNGQAPKSFQTVAMTKGEKVREQSNT